MDTEEIDFDCEVGGKSESIFDGVLESENAKSETIWKCGVEIK